VIAVGGVTIGVMALVIVLGVMNGMQNDLREKILVVNPHLRVLDVRRRIAARRLVQGAGAGEACFGRPEPRHRS